ncbi:MAG: MBL fold metallo-hydrolase, partial [Mycobacteriaceae bacterium]
MRATVLGVSTILLQDDASAIMTDGFFFSRPGLLKSLLRPLVSDEEIIAAALSRLGVTSLDALFVTHSHYDHALDAPVVAQRTGAELVGSRSAGQIAAGYSLDWAKFRLAEQVLLRRPGSHPLRGHPTRGTESSPRSAASKASCSWGSTLSP